MTNSARSEIPSCVLSIGTVKARHRALRLEISEQRELKTTGFPERAVAPHTVDGNAKQLCAVFVELPMHFVVDRHLIPADGAPVGWVERQHDWPAAEVGEPDHLVGGGLKRERRSDRARRYET